MKCTFFLLTNDPWLPHLLALPPLPRCPNPGRGCRRKEFDFAKIFSFQKPEHWTVTTARSGRCAKRISLSTRLANAHLTRDLCLLSSFHLLLHFLWGDLAPNNQWSFSFSVLHLHDLETDKHLHDFVTPTCHMNMVGYGTFVHIVHVLQFVFREYMVICFHMILIYTYPSLSQTWKMLLHVIHICTYSISICISLSMPDDDSQAESRIQEWTRTQRSSNGTSSLCHRTCEKIR